ncbi:unnamed protein product [Cuscuta campestris]|uniref:Uncharacterized protein n=1 Tax=Cuscuta campestris TaxID=132261 RepID=A0A484MWP5_9ASTE|nr:unnamed protein product [Cuscuta campestris]
MDMSAIFCMSSKWFSEEMKFHSILMSSSVKPVERDPVRSHVYRRVTIVERKEQVGLYKYMEDIGKEAGDHLAV